MTTLLLAGLLPFLVAFGASGLLARAGTAASPALALGLLAGFLALTRAIPFFGHPAQALIGEAAVVAVALAALIGWWRPRPALAGLLGVCLGAVAGGLPFGLLHPAGLDSVGLLGAALGIGLGGALVWRAEALRVAGMALPVLTILAWALAVIAAIDHAGLAANLAIGLAAAGTGLLAWTPLGRVLPDPATGLVGGALLALLAATLWATAPAVPWAILILGFGLWPDWIASGLPGKRRRRRRGRAGGRTLAGAGMPAVVAVAVAWFIEHGFWFG